MGDWGEWKGRGWKGREDRMIGRNRERGGDRESEVGGDREGRRYGSGIGGERVMESDGE